MAEIKTLLDDVIETELANLRTLPSGNEERAKAIRDLAALHKLRIEEIRAQADVDEKSERREMDGRQRREELACKDADRAREEELQNRQLREQKIDRYVRIAVAGADIDALMAGAAKAAELYGKPSLEENDCYKYAAIRNILYNKGKCTEVMVSYEPCYSMMNEWWKQLYGESEGKDNKGLFPASVILSLIHI